MQKPWQFGHRAFLGALLVSATLAPLPVTSEQPSRTNPPASGARAGTNVGPMDFMSKVWTNNRPASAPILPRTKEKIEEFNAVKQRAEQGDVEARWYVGVDYEMGLGVERDYAEAVKWFRKAAEQNHGAAQHSLGEMYQSGRGVVRDEKEAARWFQRAAENGDKEAQFELGACYYEGHGVQKSKVEAYKWFDLADCFGFGAIYSEMGVSVTNDAASMRAKVAQEMTQDQIEEARLASARVLSEIGQEARRNGGVSLCVVARLHLDKKEYTKAVELLRKGVKLGCGEAEARLGQMYLLGEGIERDNSEAFKLLYSAARHGDESGLALLAICYESGAGVPVNYEEAVKHGFGV